MEHLIYETTEDFGPFGECPAEVRCNYWEETLCPYRYDEPPEVETEARVEITSASFFSNGRRIYMDKEEASNIRQGLEDEIIEAQQLKEQRGREDHRDSGGYEG